MDALNPNPLDQIWDAADNDNKGLPANSGSPSEPVQPNPLDAMGPDLGADTSATGAFVRGAARATLPSIASFPAMGAGAQVGALAGGAVGGPPGAFVGALGGAVIAGFGAAIAANAAQDWAIEKLPDDWQEAIGQDDRQRKLDESQHGTAAFLGGLLPTVLTMRPGFPTKVPLRENATALERIMAYPATAAVFGGGVMGGMELGSQVASGQDINWTHVAVATGVGVVFNRTTKFGERLIESGARPTRRLTGQPEPVDATAPPVEASPAPEAPAEPPLAPAKPTTAREWNEAILGQKEAPTVLEAGDAKVMGPGVTESVFMGTQDQSPAAAMAAQQAVRDEQIALGKTAQPDVHRTARSSEPELFDRYEDLQAQRDDFQRWVAEAEGQAPAAAEALRTIEAEIETLSPQIAAAYRRAAEAGALEVVEPVSREAKVSEAVPTGRPTEEARNFIARDIEQKLIEAGRPPEEAAALGKLTAARYETRAARIGQDAQDLYLREAPEIAGPDGKIIKTDTPERARQDLTRIINEGASPEQIAAHPVVAEANAYNNSRPSSHLRPGYGTPEDRATREFQFKGPDGAVETVKGYGQAIVRFVNDARAYADGPTAKDREAVIVIGPPAAGKSFFSERLAKAKKAAIPDSDDVKKALPEFEGGKAASSVHEESSDIGADVLARLVEAGDNLVIPKVGHDVDKLRTSIQDLQNQGYHVSVVSMTVEPAEAYRRMIRRFLKTGRVIGSDYFTGVGTKPRENYYTLKDEGIFDDGLDIDANGPPGTQAALDNPDSPLWGILGPGLDHAGRRPQGAGEPTAAPPAPQAEPVIAAYEAQERITSLTPAQQRRELPKFTPERDSTLPHPGKDKPAGVFMFNPTALNVDAERFQFKSGGDAYGVTGALRGVQKWDPAKAQSIMVWEDNSGKLWVADGHQRAGLARRLTAEGKAPKDGIELPGVLYREVDGISASDVRAIAAVTNIANNSSSALDGAKVLRSRPDLMDESLPLTPGKGQQAAALARLGDEAFRMVLNDVVPENYGAIVGELLPKDPDRQLAAMKAIAKFEPRNTDEAAVLIQRVAAAELVKKEEGAQASMFGDLEPPESTAGEEMKIVGRVIRDLKKDKNLFGRVVSNAERIEATGSQIERAAAKTVMTDADVFAKTLASDAYSAGPIRTELVEAARDLKNGKASLGEATDRILAALRREAEKDGADRAGARGRDAESAKEYAQAKRLEGDEAKADIDRFRTEIKSRHGLSHFDLHLTNQGDLDLSMIEVPRDARKKGVGSAALQDVVDYADEQGRRIVLTPGLKDAHHGTTSRGRLVDFYKRFGFVENKGRNKDFTTREGMYRKPSREFSQSKELEFEPGAEGKPQSLIPGVEPVRQKTQRELIEERAAAPLRRGGQKAADEGLFDERRQGELFQRDQVETPEFKRWFGDSKVVDAEGKPLQVYHGTSRALDRFDPKMRGGFGGSIGYWFSSEASAAEHFTQPVRDITAGPNIVPVFLSIKQPKEYAGWQEHVEAVRAANGDSIEAKYKSLRRSLARAGYDGIVIRGSDSDSGIARDDWVAFHPEQIKSPFNRGTFDPDSPKILEQTARGKVRISEGKKPIITLMKDANASTFVHESGHVYLEELARDAFHPNAPAQLKDDLDTTLSWLGVKSVEDIKTKQHEKWARGFEQYLREGVAPSKELAGVFARFKEWLLQIYESLRGLGAPINDDIKGVFDRLLATEPQRTVIAPEREPRGPTIHDIHETEAREVSTPAEAAPKADQIEAEANRYAAELPPEVKNELETRIAELEAEIAGLKARDAGTEPGGETGAGAGEGRPVEPGSGKPGALSAGGEGGAEPSPVGERGGAVAAEGAPDVDTGNPLAPKPTTLFGPEQSPFIDKAGNIRLDTLTNVEDVRQAIRDAAAANQDFIGDRRGVVTDGQVMDVARAAGMEGAEKLVASRIRGQAFSAEEVMTLRLALVQSATDVSAAMKKAANGTDADVMAYAQAKDRHQLLQATVAQATAEAGRALRAFRNITGMTGEAKAADQIVREATGKTLFQLRQEARLGASLDTPEAVSKFMNDARKRNFGHMLLEYWINGLLSGPATHVTNITGNLLLTVQHVLPETAVAAAIGSARKALGRQGETIRVGEIGARLRSLGGALPSAMKAGAQSFAAGTGLRLPGEEARRLPFQPVDSSIQPQLDEAATYSSIVGDAYAAIQGIQDAIIATGALIKAGGEAGAPLIGTSYSATGAIPDIQVRGMTVLPVGTAARIPSRFLAAADGFFRALNYSMEKSARAYRMASEEGLSGTRFDARVAEIRTNPTEQMMSEMAEEASRLTLMDKGGKFLNALNHLANVEIGGFPALKFVMPFVHVAGTILRQGVMERTPLGILSTQIRADLMGKNGTVAQDMAMARMMFGTGLAVTFGMMAAQGQASGSGPTDRNEAAMWRLAGNQAHSVRIGDMWYGIEKLGPIGMLMGISADLYDVAHAASEGEMTDATSKLVHAFSQNILDQSMMKGPSDLLRAVNDSDRYGSQYVRNFLSAFVPYSVGMAQLAKTSDPYTNHARTVVDAIRAKIPGHMDSYFANPLYPKRDIWGEPMQGVERIGLTQIAIKQLSTDPVNVAMLQLGVSPAQVTRKIRGVELTDEQFDDYARMAGRMTKQRLDVLVRAPDWSRWPNYVRTLIIEETVKQSREVARGMILGKYPQIARDAVEAKLEKLRD